MSSSQVSCKRRCIIRKLDFENGILTNIRSRSRVRKKVRARITTQIEEIHDGGDVSQPCENSLNGSPVLTYNTREVESPVPSEKQSGGESSPVLFKKKKLSKRKDESLLEAPTSPCASTSPVFKIKLKKHSSSGKSQEVEKTFGINTSDLFSQGNSSSFGQSSYQIDDFTQESKSSVKISSVESPQVKDKSSGDYSVDSKSESSKVSNISWNKDESNPMVKWLEVRELNDSLRNTRKNYKKNSLLGRLQKLLQKQASEKLLWQHQNRGNSTAALELVIVDFWSDELKFLLKCRFFSPESDIVFLIVDRKWVPSVKNIKEGSVLHLHPPWQKLSIEKPQVTVFINVICLEISGKLEETPVKKVELQPLPVDEFECDPTPFINSLFAFRFSELLI